MTEAKHLDGDREQQIFVRLVLPPSCHLAR